MTLPFRIREAGLDDNDRLIELAKRCPMKGRMETYPDRYPDYFALTRLQGERSYIYVAESLQGDIVASAVFMERSLVIEGKLVKVLHFGDLRTDPSVRRTRIAAKLIEIYTEILKNGNYHHGIAEIFKGNTAPVKAHTHFYDSFEIRHEGEIRVYKLFPYFFYRSSKKWTYRQAEPGDLSAIAQLLQSTYQNVAGSPLFTSEWLQDALDQHSSFALSNLWVAENSNKEICACVGVWDQSSVRRTVVVRLARALKYFFRLLTIFGVFWKLPAPPREGRPLSFCYFRWLGVRSGDIPALRALLKHCLKNIRSEGKRQFVLVGMHEGDRLRPSLRGILKLKERMHIYSHRVKAGQSASPRLESKYVDLSLI